MGYRYAILGSGRQGLAAAYDIGKFGAADEIVLYDIDSQVAETGAKRLNALLKANLVRGSFLNVEDREQVEKSLRGIHSTISAVPYRHNLLITEAAIRSGSNLCDLGGNTDIVREQLRFDDAAKKHGVTVTPDCGMGPGLNISMAVHAMSFVDEPEEVLIWDGGLPQNPVPPWNYQLTFNINGLTNEYYGDAYFLRQGKVTPVPCLTEVETLAFPPPLGQLEAAVTSGGLSTAPWTFAGKLQRLENKTLRYPGHWQQFAAFQQLGLFESTPVMIHGHPLAPRDFYHALLEPKITSEKIRDICVIRTQCNGKTDGRKAACTLELMETYNEETGFTAMEQLTGWHASIIAILSARGVLPKGAVPVELALTGEIFEKATKLRGWDIKNSIKE